MSATSDVESEVEGRIVDYLRRTPHAVAVLFFSFMSGQLWTFVIAAYCRRGTRGNKLLQSITGRTAAGLAWFAIVMVPVYALYNQRLDFDYANVLSLVVPTIVIGLSVQVVIFACFVRFGK